MRQVSELPVTSRCQFLCIPHAYYHPDDGAWLGQYHFLEAPILPILGLEVGTYDRRILSSG
jgi:hypothetical protein